MPVVFTMDLGPFERASRLGIERGLVAAAEVYIAPVRERLQQGYTSGDFTTGNAANSVSRGSPEMTEAGGSIAVGSTQVDPPYPLFWEMGHMSVFTRKYERVPIWGPTAVEKRDEMIRAVEDEVRAAS